MEFAQGTVLSLDPLIIYSSQYQSPHAAINRLAAELADREAIFLLLIAWSIETPDMVASARSFCDQHRALSPRHRVIFMANTEAECELLHAAGVEAHHANHNIFLDPSVFHPVENAPIRYDAVYNGQLQRWKRQELARDVPSLALIYYGHDGDGITYCEQLHELLPNAYFANETMANPPHGWLGGWEINQLYAASRCGLCLSAVEGAMYASTEYLLAGLPVVSTPNQGGRDEFFDAENCIVAEPNPTSIAAAVAQWGKHAPSRLAIRAGTLERLEDRVYEFQNFINALIRESGGKGDVRRIWSRINRHKLVDWLPAEGFVSEFEKRLKGS